MARDNPQCVLCGVEIMNAVVETTEGPMCPDANGCRRNAVRILTKIAERLEATVFTLPNHLCWQGPTYAHGAHVWTEDKPGGETYYCPGASTDRT